MRPNIVVLDDWTNFWAGQPAVDRLRERGDLTIHTTPAVDEGEVMRRLDHATVALANRERTRLDARVLRAAENLELIGQTGRISPNIDANAATERGIALVAAGGQPGSHVAVAELGLALMLAWRARSPATIAACVKVTGSPHRRACSAA